MSGNPLTLPIYIPGGVDNTADAIVKIKQMFATYSDKKYVNIIGVVEDLSGLRAAFPNHVIIEKWPGNWIIQPKA